MGFKVHSFKEHALNIRPSKIVCANTALSQMYFPKKYAIFENCKVFCLFETLIFCKFVAIFSKKIISATNYIEKSLICCEFVLAQNERYRKYAKNVIWTMANSRDFLESNSAVSSQDFTMSNLQIFITQKFLFEID